MTYSPYNEEAEMEPKKKNRKKRHLQINKRKKKKKHVWLSGGRLHIEGRLNEGRSKRVHQRIMLHIRAGDFFASKTSWIIMFTLRRS